MGKKKKTKESQETKVKESKLIFDMVLKHKELIKVVIGGLAVAYSIINYVHNYTYQKQCEDFFGIPSRYFSDSISIKLLYFFVMMCIIASIFAPSALLGWYKKQGKEDTYSNVLSISVSVLLSLMLVVINAQNLIIIIQFHNKNKIFKLIVGLMNQNIAMVLVIIVIIIVIAPFAMILWIKVRQKIIKNICLVMFWVSFIANIIVLICATQIKIGTTIEDKTKYEIVVNMERQYVVLSEENEKVLVVEYCVKDGKYVFNTKKYLFLNKYDCEFSYIDTGVSPKIENADNKG